jgi:hypothetical protein
MAMTPTLGCQIAPHYEHDPMSDSSDVSTDEEDEITETEERGDREEATNATDLEKAETQRDTTAARPAVLQKGRTRSSRRAKEGPHPPVGFWHWKMVSVVVPAPRFS